MGLISVTHNTVPNDSFTNSEKYLFNCTVEGSHSGEFNGLLVRTYRGCPVVGRSLASEHPLHYRKKKIEKEKLRAKSYLCLIKLLAMKTYGSGGIAPRILNLSNRTPLPIG
jgi:hypothetical protein